MTKEQVTQKLQGMGYTDIRKLEADDGHWEGDATKAGVSYEIHVDPHTGDLTKNEPKHGKKDDPCASQLSETNEGASVRHPLAGYWDSGRS